jgi:hypothetical protein
MISYELKDRVLKDLVSQGMSYDIDLFTYASKHTCCDETMEALLDYFQDLGFIETLKCAGGQVTIFVKVYAHDFVGRGGFTIQEELLKKNIEKLLLEIESLKPSMNERIERITAIASNIATALGFFVAR